MTFSTTDLVIWCLGGIVHLCLMAVLLVKKRWQRYPIFTSFILYQNLVPVVLVLVYKQQLLDLYYYLFWISEALCFLFEVAVSVELFATIWRSATPIPQVPWFILMRSVVISLFIASLGAYGLDTAHLSTFDRLTMKGAVFTSILLSGCFVAISFQANALHLRRSRHAMIIGWGLIGIALLELSEDCRFFTHGWHPSANASDHVEDVLYALIVLFWTAGMWRTDSVRWSGPGRLQINRAMSR